MKLLMTTDTVGGVWTYALELAGALAPHGVEIALATQGAPLTSDQWEDVRRLENVEVHESSFQLEWMRHSSKDVEAAGNWLMELADGTHPDLIHLNEYSHAALDWNAPVLVVGHSCVFSWFESVRRMRPGPEWSEYRRRVTRGLHSADLVVAPTQAMLDALRRFYGLLSSPLTRRERAGVGTSASRGHGVKGRHLERRADSTPRPRGKESQEGIANGFRRTRVIFNGRDAARYRAEAKKPFVLAAGRLWDEGKNIGTLAQAATQVDWPIRVAGEEWQPDGGQAQFSSVEFLGRLSSRRMADAFARASIYALPARYEPFGLSPVEAALSQCALVLGDIPSLREVWGDAATFVAPNDAEALATTLNRLIADPARRAQNARRAYERARSFTPARMAREYLEAYRELTLTQRPAVTP